ERGMPGADEGIVRILAPAEGRERELRRDHHRHVLERMHRDVGAAFVERDLELLHEEPLAADLSERPVEDAIAPGRHAHRLHREARMAGAERFSDHFRLAHREAAFPRGDADTCGDLWHGTDNRTTDPADAAVR